MGSYGVSVFNIDTCQLNRLYTCIEKIEEAELLSQLEMTRKADNELIVIMPGYNKGIRNYSEEFNRALKLAEEYRD